MKAKTKQTLIEVLKAVIYAVLGVFGGTQL